MYVYYLAQHVPPLGSLVGYVRPARLKSDSQPCFVFRPVPSQGRRKQTNKRRKDESEGSDVGVPPTSGSLFHEVCIAAVGRRLQSPVASQSPSCPSCSVSRRDLPSLSSGCLALRSSSLHLSLESHSNSKGGGHFDAFLLLF